MVARLGAGLLALVLAVPAVAHEAASGWAYPPSCCSGQDCYQITADDLGADQGGYHVKATGETIPYTDRKVKPSGDGFYHRCSWMGSRDAATICLFVPSGS